MKCDHCSNSATIHLVSLENGEIQDLHLCESCANQHKSLKASLGVADFLAGLTSFENIANSVIPDRSTALRCSTCGLNYDEFKKTGRFGCAECYMAFYPSLQGMLKSIHGSSTHGGKEPEFIAPLRTKMPEPVDSADALRAELQQAIDEENFEHAAELRDRIHEIEGRKRG